MVPWGIDPAKVTQSNLVGILIGFKNNPRDMAVSIDELEREYCTYARQPYPIVEMGFARSWMLFRVSTAI